MFYLKIITSYILPVIYDSCISLIFVLVFLNIFRIKDSNLRILFFFLPLIKPFIAVSEKINLNELYISSRPGTAGFRFADPTNIISIRGQSDIGKIFLLSNANYLILTIIISFIAFFLIIRWLIIALFYKRLVFEDKVFKKDVPDLFNIIENYIKKINIKKIPDVSLTHGKYYSPFIVGVRRFTLVISPNLLENLTESEKETVIYHELSHIKRNDNLIGWMALILRDLNFFNPFGYLSYFLIKSEQESGCDKLVLKFSGKKPVEIANDFLNSIKKIITLENFKNRFKTSVPPQSSSFLPVRSMYQKRLSNRVNSILRTNPDKIYAKIFPRVLSYFLFIFLLLIQIIYIIKINDIIMFLR